MAHAAPERSLALMKTVRKLVAVRALMAAHAVGARPVLLRGSATEEEVAGPYPGAGLVPGGKRGATMAVTINAPPSRLWPWLVQMGCDRAGWYSWDRLDNGGVPSAERIHSRWQEINVGDHLASSPSGNTWFHVAAVEPARFLALRASFDLRGRPFDPAGPRPRSYTDSVWCFVLQELAGERTRLVVSSYASARPRPVQAIIAFVFWEPAHWIMQKRQFANLKRRAEREPAAGDQAPVRPNPLAAIACCQSGPASHCKRARRH
jgi:proline iminopeptidase